MVKFANRMDSLRNSEIQDLLKWTSEPSIISFAGGMPAPELFPVEGVKRAFTDVMNHAGRSALQYASTNGISSLREKIVERMSRRCGIETTADNILITSGSQQGLDFSARIFINPGDTVLVESPSYVGALNAFKACGPKFIEVPTDDNGMDPEALEAILASTPNVKLIYVIPDFQNPTGKTWSLERRVKFMELIDRYEIPVVEDAPYSELRFEGEMLPSLKSMDHKDLVIYLGTMSKILAPGLRIGWMCASKAILEECNYIKQSADMQTATLNQMLVSNFLDRYDLDAHVQQINHVYSKRRNVMLDAIGREFPEEVQYTHPQGGLFIWCTLPPYLNAKELAAQCLEKHVAYVPGGNFFPNGGKENYFRLNYSCMPEDKIVTGIGRIAEVIKSNLH